MGFSSQEHWSGLPFPSPGDLPNPGIEPRSPALPADSLPSEPPGKPQALGTPVISHTTLDPCDRSYPPLPHLQICDAGGLGPPGLQQVLDAGPAPEPCNGSLCPWGMVAVIHHRASFPVGGLSLPPEPQVAGTVVGCFQPGWPGWTPTQDPPSPSALRGWDLAGGSTTWVSPQPQGGPKNHISEFLH